MLYAAKPPSSTSSSISALLQGLDHRLGRLQRVRARGARSGTVADLREDLDGLAVRHAHQQFALALGAEVLRRGIHRGVARDLGRLPVLVLVLAALGVEV